MSTYLIVNADDFALTTGVSSGILSARQNGIVTVTTVLMTADGAVEDINRALRFDNPLSLGVHLNLTHGRPLSEPHTVRSLLDSQGRFTSLDWKRAHRAEIDPEHVRGEWRRQIRLFLQTGAVIDHLDCHHFAAALTPDIWEIYLDLAAEYQCGARPLPEQASNLAPVLAPNGGNLTSPATFNRRLRQRAIPTPDHFLTNFYGASATLDHLLEIIQYLPAGTVELMVHPGLHDAELSSISGYTHERQRELGILTDPAVRRALSDREVKLIDYRGAGLA